MRELSEINFKKRGNILMDDDDWSMIDKNNYFNAAVVADDLIGIDNVNQRLWDGHPFYAGHIEAVHVVPPYKLIYFTTVHSFDATILA